MYTGVYALLAMLWLQMFIDLRAEIDINHESYINKGNKKEFCITIMKKESFAALISPGETAYVN